jgi:tRNA modification GTPase
MYSVDDTIVAIATPAGRGGIGVVRVSGPAVGTIADTIRGCQEPLEPRRATLARILTADGVLDRVILTFFPAPHSYTGEDVLEISAHGSPVVLRAIVVAVMTGGARLAEPGEFTLRAYLAGRLDLVQAEAVHDLVEAATPLQARVAFDQLEGTLTARIREIDEALFDLSARLEASLDFPEEGYHFVAARGAAAEIARVIARLDDLLIDAGRGRLIREGAQVTIMGRPNSGKSSVFNRLAGAARAIVTDIPGTTRDLLTELVDIEGLPVTLVDTAGLRGVGDDAVENEGIARARAACNVANLSIVVLDHARPLCQDDHEVLRATASRSRVLAVNKSDLAPAWHADEIEGVDAIHVSAKTGEGFRALRAAIARTLAGLESPRDAPAVSNVRHADLLARARAALQRAHAAAECGTSEEFVIVDVAEARRLVEEVTGARTSDDVLHAIFDKFCIGK